MTAVPSDNVEVGAVGIGIYADPNPLLAEFLKLEGVSAQSGRKVGDAFNDNVTGKIKQTTVGVADLRREMDPLAAKIDTLRSKMELNSRAFDEGKISIEQYRAKQTQLAIAIEETTIKMEDQARAQKASVAAPDNVAGSAFKGGIAGAFAFGAIQAGVGLIGQMGSDAVKAADAFSLMRSRLQLVVKEGEDLEQVETALFNVAQDNRTDLEATVGLYTRIRAAQKGLTDAQAIDIVDKFGKTLLISGANAQAAATSTNQFAQALASGKLQGDEFKTLLEQNTRFSTLLADSLKVNVGDLKTLASQGKLTVQTIVDAFQNGGGSLTSEAAAISVTIGQAGVNLGNAWTRFVGVIDQSLGLSKGLASAVQGIADSIANLAHAFDPAIAKAEDLEQKWNTVNRNIAADEITRQTKIDEINKLYEDQATAITGTGSAAIAAKDLELGALDLRIAKNKELAREYAIQTELQINKAEQELAQKQRGSFAALVATLPQRDGTKNTSPGVKASFDDITYGVPRTDDPSFGDTTTQAKNVLDQIHKLQQEGKQLSEGQKRFLDEYLGIHDAEIKLGVLKTQLKSLKEGIDIKPKGDTKVDIPTPPEKPKRVNQQAGYYSPEEELARAIKDIKEANKDGDPGGSRAAVQAIQDYYKATDDLFGALIKLRDLKKEVADGKPIITEEDAQLAERLIRDADKVAEDKDIEKRAKEYGEKLRKDLKAAIENGGEPIIPQVDVQVDVPDFQTKSPTEQYLDDHTADLEKGINEAFFNAAKSGNWGQAFQDKVEDGLDTALKDAIDNLTKNLFNLLSKIDWGSLFGGSSSGTGWGGFFAAIGTAFGGAKASGGGVKKGMSYNVGELGAERFVAPEDGYIVPNNQNMRTPMVKQTIQEGDLNVTVNGNLDNVTMNDLKRAISLERAKANKAIDARVANRQLRGAL